ncbi:hypothetical protein HPB47_002355 [Ixodes persulcatus]|uniref:Uncharacterized protein n=1 Tax=Ixodes persulcatus TaxID=34615 RepID=A0AC60PN20_IXOPE|nr:hypothetical protein HPB47_002355 [Ixodes persulcatus]
MVTPRKADVRKNAAAQRYQVESRSAVSSIHSGRPLNPARQVLRPKPLANFLQRRPADDVFPETETMFPLLSDSRFETSMTNYLAESPPETPVPTRHAHTSRAGASGLSHSGREGCQPPSPNRTRRDHLPKLGRTQVRTLYLKSPLVYVKILQDALSNQDSSPNSALMVTPDVDTGWFLVSFHVWVRHDHKPLTDAVKRFPKPGATYFVQGGSGTL